MPDTGEKGGFQLFNQGLSHDNSEVNLGMPEEVRDHGLGLESLINYEVKESKQSISQIMYIHKMVKCFYADDIYKHIIETISERIISNLENKKQQRVVEMENVEKSKELTAKRIQEKQMRELDPIKLAKKVEVLQQKLDKQTKDFYQELSVYRHQFRKQQNASIQKDFKQFFEVRLFDECDQIPQDYRDIMNQKITDIQNQYSIYVQSQLQTQRALLIKLHCYEKLNPKQYCLIDLSLDEIMQALPILEQNAQTIWDMMEKHYYPNYFEQVIYKKYGYIFEDKNEDEFRNEMLEIRNEVKGEVLELEKQYENIVKIQKSEYGEKMSELFEVKQKYYNLVETCQRQEEDFARSKFEEKERLIFSQWEQERSGMMDEIKDLENEHAHIEVMLSKERFRAFVFKWRILNKINKMVVKYDRDSYEFMKATLEVQEQVKTDIDARVEVVTHDLKQKYEHARKERYDLLEDMCELRFENGNLQRLLGQKNKIIEELIWQSSTYDANLRYTREKNKELENEASTMKIDNTNLQEMVKALEEKNNILIKKMEKILVEQNLSFLDFKVVFGRPDKTLTKTKMIDEITEVLRHQQKKLKKLQGVKDVKHQTIGTELRNIAKEICYKVEHGMGILVNQETQIERIPHFGREIQTEEVDIIFQKKEDTQSKQDYYPDQKESLSNRASAQKTPTNKSNNQSVLTSLRSSIQNMKLSKDQPYDTLKSKKGSGTADSGHQSDRKLQKKVTIGQITQEQKMQMRRMSTLQRQKTLKKQDSQDQDDSIDNDDLIDEEQSQLNDTGEVQHLDESQYDEPLTKQKVTNKSTDFRGQTKMPQVFSRLWNLNQKRDAKLKQQRVVSREREEYDWKVKLANQNQLQKTFQGMNVYTDPKSGKSFIHIDDLRQRVQQQVNDKDQYVVIEDEAMADQGTMMGESMQESSKGHQEMIKIYNDQELQSKDNLFLLDSSVEYYSPEKQYLNPQYNKRVQESHSTFLSKRSQSFGVYNGSAAKTTYTNHKLLDPSTRSMSQENKYLACKTPSQISAFQDTMNTSSAKNHINMNSNKSAQSYYLPTMQQRPKSKYDSLIGTKRIKVNRNKVEGEGDKSRNQYFNYVNKTYN